MKSGLEDRNNRKIITLVDFARCVSMKSGLEDRNNLMADCFDCEDDENVSMKSGLEDRNNRWKWTQS